MIHKANFQLLGITCLYIACKVEESRPPRADELARTTDGACSALSICEFERCVLRLLEWRLQAVTAMHWLRLMLKLAISRLHARLLEALTLHFAQSPLCGDRLAQMALALDDPLQSLGCSPCDLCASLYLAFQADLRAFLSLSAFHAAAQLCDLALFDLHSLHYFPSAVATSALLVAHSDAPSRLQLLCEVSGYSVDVLSALLVQLHKWNHFPVQPRQVWDEEELVTIQPHYRGALDRWKAAQRVITSAEWREANYR